MADRVRMKSRTVFANDLITVFPEGGPPEGVLGGAVVDGQEFVAGLNLAKDLDRLGHAEPLNRSDLEGDAAPLEPHYQVSVPALLADQLSREQAQERQDGPTIAEFTAAGYPASNHPPQGYAARSSAEEIAAAIATEGTGPEPLTDADEAAEGNASEPTDAAIQSSTKRRNAASRQA